MIKRILVLFLALITLSTSLLLLSSCKSEAEEIPGYKNITKDFEDTDKLVDYKFFVPENWIVEMSTGVVAAKYSETDPSNISVTIFSIPDEIYEYHEKVLFEYDGDNENEPTLIDSCFNYYLDGLNETFSDFSLDGSSSTLLDGKAAKKYVYTAKLLSVEYKYLQVFCVKNNDLYVVTFTSTAEKFDSHTEAVNNMISYFKFD